MTSLKTSTNSPAGLPVKIRAYGLLPITRRGYVIVQVCCFTAILLALSWLTLSPPDIDAYRKLAERAPTTDQLPLELLTTALDNARTILLVVLAVGVLESILMLRKFKSAESQAASHMHS